MTHIYIVVYDVYIYIYLCASFVILYHDRHKVIKTQQAKICNYKKTRLKLLKKNATIWYNEICKTKQLMSKYCGIKLNGIKRQSRTSEL